MKCIFEWKSFFDPVRLIEYLPSAVIGVSSNFYVGPSKGTKIYLFYYWHGSMNYCPHQKYKHFCQNQILN